MRKINEIGRGWTYGSYRAGFPYVEVASNDYPQTMRFDADGRMYLTLVGGHDINVYSSGLVYQETRTWPGAIPGHIASKIITKEWGCTNAFGVTKEGILFGGLYSSSPDLSTWLDVGGIIKLEPDGSSLYFGYDDFPTEHRVSCVTCAKQRVIAARSGYSLVWPPPAQTFPALVVIYTEGGIPERSFEIPHPIGGLLTVKIDYLIANETRIFVVGSGYIFAFDWNGTELWRKQLTTVTADDPPYGSSDIPNTRSNPTCDDENLMFFTPDYGVNRLYEYDLDGNFYGGSLLVTSLRGPILRGSTQLFFRNLDKIYWYNRAAQTEWHAYHLYTRESIGTAPDDDALSNANAYAHPQNLTQMRDAVETLVVSKVFLNPATGNPYHINVLGGGDVEDHLIYAALTNSLNDYNTEPRTYWLRSVGEMENTPMYDIDIGEIYECVRTLEDADLW